MRFNFLLLCIFWLFVLKGYGQVDPSVIPPTPNVASLTKYVDFPVGTYSGIPSINIPLYEIKSGDITVPISLSYHALGVAVSDEASWVGLNWALNAGGVVTQQIHGLSDFATFGFFNSPPIIDTDCYGGPQADPFNMQDGNNGFCYGHDMIGNYSMWRSQRSRVNGQVVDYTNYCAVPFDWEPDVFKFNFGQYSGRFVFNQDREIFLLDQENLKIQEQWEITSPEGIVYEFKKNEQEAHNGQLASQSWYLTKIRSAVGDRTVDFEYEEGSPASTHEDWTFSTSINRIAGGTTGSVTSVGSGTSTQSMRTYTPVYLKKISWENNYVEFVRETTEREDLRGEQRLKYIRVYNQSGALVKEYELVTSYNVAVSDAPCPHVSYIDQAARDRDFKRLMLDQLVERSAGENLITRFDYNQTALPQKTSLAKDYWGFYNGAYNTNLLPPFQQKIYADAGIDYYNLTGAYRDPDEARSQSRILTKITYPTSGSTLFQYELNEYHNSTEQPVPHSYYVYKEVYAGVPGQSGPVTFDYNPRDPKYISAELRINGYCPSCTHLPAPSYIILKKNGTAVANLALSTLASNYPNNTTEVHQGSLHTISFNAPLNLILGDIDGTIELSVQAPSSSNQFVVSADVALTLLEVVTQKKKTGGLRIAKQTHINDANDPKPLVTRVLYDNGSRSSGKVMRQPTFHSIIPIGGLVQYRLNISSSSLAPSMGVNGGIVGYSKVTVLKGNDGEFGKTELFYHNKADSFYTYTIRPAGLPVVPHEFNGKMKLKIDFARHGAVYDTVRVEENTYELGFKILIKALATGGAQQCFSTYVNGILHYYPIYGNWVRLKSSQVEDFSSNGGSKTIALKSFSYQPVSFYGDGRIYTLEKDIAVTDMPRHFNHIKAAETTSDGIVKETKFTYPGDYSSPSTVIVKMLEKNMDGIPVEQSEWRNSKLLSVTATRFAYSATTDKVLPENVLVLETETGLTNYSPSTNGIDFDSRLTVKGIFYKYDHKGNLLDYGRKSNFRTVYLWGYNETLPVAKIENATYDAVVSAIGQTDIDLIKGNTLSESNLRMKIAALRQSLPASKVTGYTYDPLVGLRSVTDENNLTTSYEYDGFNRLKLIKDHSGNILKTIEYHVKN